MRDPRGGQRRARAALRRRQADPGRHRHEHPGGQQQPAGRADDHQDEAAVRHVGRRRRDTRRAGSPGRRARYFRPQRRRREGNRAGQDRVRCRPAAVPAGLPGGRDAHALQVEPERARRRPAGVDRPQLDHKAECRCCGTARRRGHTMTAATARVDERVAHVGVLRRLLLKPELGALVGVIVIFVFFAAQSDVFRSWNGAANWLDVSSALGLMAVPVALLMIGGHFDLSAGVQTATAGLATGIMTTYWGLQLYASWAVSLALMLTIGFINGFLVTRTGLPSFIITLGMFLGLQGLNLGVTKQVTNQVQVSNIDLVPGYHALNNILASTVTIGGAKFPIAIIWWVGFTVLGSYLLLKTRFGNWIFATGGDANASKNVGVRTGRTTIALFMMVSFMAWFVGNTQLIRFTSIQAQSGIGQELYYIAAAVIGGCLLTGGFGSVVGASLGALIFGMTEVGIVNVGWNSDWFKLFVGVMLLLAVLANQFTRQLAEQSRR